MLGPLRIFTHATSMGTIVIYLEAEALHILPVQALVILLRQYPELSHSLRKYCNF